MPYHCKSCEENPNIPDHSPAVIQIAGYWLCRMCQDQLAKRENGVYCLMKLRESYIKDGCYFIIWDNFKWGHE
jgi:hypothetical protein